MKIKIIYGPPCAGKSTYVNENIGDNDIRFDYDMIMQSISNRQLHEYSDEHHPYVVEYRELIITMAAEDESSDTAYVISTKISDKLKEEIEGKDVDFLLIDTSKDQCYENLEDDDTRSDKSFWKEQIDAWFDWYDDYLKEVRNSLNKDRKKENQQKNKFFDMKMSADGKSGDIFIYGEITKYAWEDEGEHSAQTFKKELDKLGDVSQINLYVNSPGGSVFEGITIHNMLKRHNAHVTAYVDALAASIASVIVMAADKIVMPSNTMLMIHNPWTFAIGNAADLRKQADDLDRIGESAVQSYIDKAGDKLQEDKLRELLDAETWLSANESLELGLCDVVEEANDMAACIGSKYMQRYKNIPKQLQKESPSMSEEEKALRQKISDEAKANSELTKTILGGIYS